MVEVRVRRPGPGDGNDIARVHVRAWQAGYRNLMPTDFLDGLDEVERGRAWEQRLVERHRNPESQVDELLVAELDQSETDAESRLVGIATLGPERFDGRGSSPPSGELWMINILPTAWSLGIGSQLVEAVVERLGELGYDEATLWALEGNRRARRFYERHGWRLDGDGKSEIFGGRELREVRYRRSLRGPSGQPGNNR